MYGVIRNASEVNQGKLSLDNLGVRAIDDQTLEVKLEYPIPYFISLTSFATFYPLSKKFINKHGPRFGTEAKYTLYNGPFTLTEWKHEQSFTLKKNPNYWDNQTVKLEEINYSIVKNTSTSVNLYDTRQFDRIGLDAEYVDSFRSSSEFEASQESTVFFLRLNQKDKLLRNKKARQAINMAWDKELFVNTILNNGSIPANFLVPREFVRHPISKRDFRDLNGDLIKTNKNQARRIWREALKEVGIKKYTLELLNFDDETARKTGEYLKEELQNTLPGLTVEIKPQPFKQKNELVRNGDYQMSYDGWGPDFLDPISFIDMFVKDGPFNNMNYYNPKFDEYVKKAKGEYLTNLPLRWNALLQAERILFQDAAIAPMYQRGRALVTRPYVKNVVRHSVGGDISFKWAYIEN
jgi:oligopeptide transport system substrate-binding protein